MVIWDAGADRHEANAALDVLIVLKVDESNVVSPWVLSASTNEAINLGKSGNGMVNASRSKSKETNMILTTLR